jgi:hypothetical protein
MKVHRKENCAPGYGNWLAMNEALPAARIKETKTWRKPKAVPFSGNKKHD